LRAPGLAISLLLAAALGGCGGGGGDNGGGSPPSGASSGFYGVISAEPLPGAPELARLGQGKAGTLRINLAWGSVQSGPGASFDWSHYDPVVGAAARNGIRVFATVYSSPTWAEPTPEYPPLGSRLPQFESFVRAAVRRYGSDGSFWKENPGLPKLPIVDWQAWNEPNSPLFWKPTPDASIYLELLRGFDTAVKGADPRAKIILGGLFPTPKGGIAMTDFLAQLYGGGARGLFNAAALHPYAATPQKALSATGELRNTMDGAGDSGAPIWISEVGWASGGQPSGLTVGPERQADYLRQTFELAAENRKRLGIDGVIWYSLNDTPGPLWPGHCGLFTVDGAPKPAWDAFTALTGGAS
jgi:polysaccharide biosynthesis protein PslG